MQVAIYTRISPNPNKTDTENQERGLEEFAFKQGWEIVARYKDIHVSGSKKSSDRPQFKKMMTDASQKKFDLLLFWSLDRITREGVQATINCLNQLNSWGIDYRSFKEQYIDSCGVFREVVIAIMATIAKQERIRLIERTMAGLETAKARGKKLGRPKATRPVGKREVALQMDIAIRMREKGSTLKQIANRFKMSEATICRYLKGVGSKPIVMRIENATEENQNA